MSNPSTKLQRPKRAINPTRTEILQNPRSRSLSKLNSLRYPLIPSVRLRILYRKLWCSCFMSERNIDSFLNLKSAQTHQSNLQFSANTTEVELNEDSEISLINAQNLLNQRFKK